MASDGTALKSALLAGSFTAQGIPHGFFPAEMNARAVADALGVASSQLHQCVQVHGAAVREASGESTGEIDPAEADALVARAPGVGVAVRTADCVPVLMANTATGHVAAVHAGWRGTVAGVVENAWHALGGADLVAIGPHIGACCFEVSEEVGLQIGTVVERHAPGKVMVDLAAAVRRQLIALGATADKIDTLAVCTKCNPSFPSYRRDGAHAGRMLSAIATGR